MSATCFNLVKESKDSNRIGNAWDLKVVCESAIRERPGQPFKCELLDNKPLVKSEDKGEWIVRIIKNGYSFAPKWCPKNGD